MCNGCCDSRSDSVEKGAKLVQQVFLHAISIPALNKWTTVAPCINLVAAMQHFCNVVPQAFGRCFPAGPSAESSGLDMDEGKELGVPLDQTKAWRKLARKRQRKATHFLTDAQSRWLTMLWAIVTSPVMTVHYSLFKRGTWFTQRPKEDMEDTSSAFSADAKKTLLGRLAPMSSTCCWTRSALKLGALLLGSMAHCLLGHSPGSERPGGAFSQLLGSYTGNCWSHGRGILGN